ncbi:MAG: TonB-dependent receptor [Candidatus Marinimicrobia bacterium]|nr:TonB-dependent receptor [Candidatus Neomarinimicrobiota bacterium]
MLKILRRYSSLFLLSGALGQELDESHQKLLQMSIYDLMQIKVTTANKKEEKIDEVPASVIIITRKEIAEKGYTTLPEIIEHIPGIFKVDDYYWLGSQNFGVRGFFSTGPMNNLIILVNGVNQLSDKYSDYPDVKINVPVEAIDRIEIIKGPMSVIYGSGAFFGAINIITNKLEEGSQPGLFSASFGSLNTSQLFFRKQYRVQNFEYVLNAGYYHTDGIEAAFSKMTSDLSILESVGLTEDATIKGQKTEGQTFVGLYLKDKDFYADFSVTENNKGVFDGQPNLKSGSILTTNAYNIVMGYHYDFHEKWKSEIKAGMYKHGHLLNYEVFFKNYYETDAQHTHSFDIEWNNFFQPDEKMEINLGLYQRTVMQLYQFSDFGYYNVKFGGGEIGLPKDTHYSSQSVYTQVSYTINDRLKLLGGVRLDHTPEYPMHYSRGYARLNGNNGLIDTTNYRVDIQETYQPDNHGFTTVSRAAAIYHFDKSVLKLMWGQASKQPSYTENYRQLPGGYPFPEVAEINTFEINYLSSFLKDFNLNISLFYNTLDNLISTTNIYDSETGEWDIFSYSSGKQRTLGTELDLSLLITEKAEIKFDLMVQQSKDLRKGYEDIKPGYSPHLLGSFALLLHPTEDLSLAASARYIDKIYTVWRTVTTPQEGSRLGNALNPQYLLDLNLRMDPLFNSHFYAMIKVKNLLDIERRYPTTTSNSWADKGTLGEPRTCSLTIGTKF